MEDQSLTKYNLGTLHEEFARHAEEQERQNQHEIERFKELHPNKELPPHLQNPFNLAWALKVMALELKNLSSDYYS